MYNVVFDWLTEELNFREPQEPIKTSGLFDELLQISREKAKCKQGFSMSFLYLRNSEAFFNLVV